MVGKTLIWVVTVGLECKLIHMHDVYVRCNGKLNIQVLSKRQCFLLSPRGGTRDPLVVQVER